MKYFMFTLQYLFDDPIRTHIFPFNDFVFHIPYQNCFSSPIVENLAFQTNGQISTYTFGNYLIPDRNPDFSIFPKSEMNVYCSYDMCAVRLGWLGWFTKRFRLNCEIKTEILKGGFGPFACQTAENVFWKWDG